MYNKYDRVRIETTWRTRLRKENEARLEGPRPIFQMNMANTCTAGGFLRLKVSHNRMETVTEKEIKQSPQQRMSAEGLDPSSLEVLTINHMKRKPSEKWDIPMTAQQESSWLMGKHVQPITLCPSASTGALERRRKAGGTMPQLPGSLVCTRRDRWVPELAQSLTTPANDLILARVRSAPNLPLSEPSEQIHQINNRKWYRPKPNLCDVVAYAEVYATMNHHNPFSSAAR